MSTLDPRIEKLRVEYGLERTDFWELPQKKGTWLVKHSALETVAAKANITFDMPEIIEARSADKVAVIVVRGFKGDRSEWSFGEASPLNNRNTYPFAMAEKRGKDRVILKLAGLHGLVYSEDEIGDEEPRRAGYRDDGTKTSHLLKKEGSWEEIDGELTNDLADCHSLVALENIKTIYRAKAIAAKWNRDFLQALVERFGQAEAAIKAAEDAEFPGDPNYRHPIMAG